jgi:hypothetical protein
MRGACGAAACAASLRAGGVSQARELRELSNAEREWRKGAEGACGVRGQAESHARRRNGRAPLLRPARPAAGSQAGSLAAQTQAESPAAKTDAQR